MKRFVERFTATKPKLLNMLTEIDSLSSYSRTVFITPESLNTLDFRIMTDGNDFVVKDMVTQIRDASTGLAIFFSKHCVVGVVPPFPLLEDIDCRKGFTEPLKQIFSQELTIGVILLRLGRYSVGVIEKNELVKSKTGSRYVKRRHKAGGTSQRRFERSRERWNRELFDATCRSVEDVFDSYDKQLNYVFMGGERNILRNFMNRCEYLKKRENRITRRLLKMRRPSHTTLRSISPQIWESQVVVFDPSTSQH